MPLQDANPTPSFGGFGLSGGPVVFAPNGKSVGELRVAGIVSEAPKPRLETVVDKAVRWTPLLRQHEG